MLWIGQYRQRIVLLLLLVPFMTGCTSIYRSSVPVTSIRDPRMYDSPRSNQEPINFVRLRQDPPVVYQLGPRDVLGIYIEGIIGTRDTPPPVHFPEERVGTRSIPPSIGFPIPVREDGTISLPLIPAINVTGLTLAQVERLIRKAYTVDQQILNPGRDRMIVTLMRQRKYQILVIREDSTTAPARAFRSGEIALESNKRGLTHLVELPAYENDVLHALAESGGLPGNDAKNEVKILRGGFRDAQELDQFLGSAEGAGMRDEVMAANPNVIRIPLRSSPGDPPLSLTEDDIILATGDIVVIESRENEVFYTGGLIKGGQYPIPRDYDLDVLGAMAMAGGSIAAAAGGSGSVGGSSRAGVGTIFPPTRVVVIRTTDEGQQTTIGIDLKTAVLNPSERILIQPNDLIILEYSTTETALNILMNNLQINLSLDSFFN